MENQTKKNSVNTVIYLLLAAMLAAVVFVSVWTVASKKSRREAPDTTDSVSEVSPDDPRIPVTSASDIPENETGIDASASTDGTPDDTAPTPTPP